MTYDFDRLIPRRGTDSYKWDSAAADDVLPMWVADMDFPTAPAIVDALRHRVDHGIFGYTRVPDAYYASVIDWFRRRHGWTIDREWFIYTSGVVPAVSAILKALTRPGDKVLVQTPVYNCFFSSIRNNGCTMVASPLVRQGNTYVVDYADLERCAADPAVKVMLLCNPHNPAGRVWTLDELQRIGDICLRHGVTVVADEIHCELVMPGHHYTPFASVSDEFLRQSVTCFSPSKAFNIAGLQIANIVCADAERRARIDRAINDNEVCDVNPFGVIALQAAYNEGEAWLDALKAYLHANYVALQAFFSEHLPQLAVTKLEGTYLVWVDISSTGLDADTLTDRLLHEAKVMVNSGTMYGREAGKQFIRINIACPKARLMEALKRIKLEIDNLSTL